MTNVFFVIISKKKIMQTLQELNNDQLIGIKQLTISENLSEFPPKIFDLADSLEILDLSNNKLTSIPNLERLTNLKIAFFSYNLFKELPSAFNAYVDGTITGRTVVEIDSSLDC